MSTSDAAAAGRPAADSLAADSLAADRLAADSLATDSGSREIEAVLAALRAAGDGRQVACVLRQPRRARTTAPLPAGLDRRLGAYLEEAGIELYRHQAEALDWWQAGRDVLLATRTASGKSLAYNLAVADSLLRDREARALYVFPTKALSHQQVRRLVALDEALGLDARPAAYDGDTPAGQRAAIRNRARIVATNPYGLHEYLSTAFGRSPVVTSLGVLVVDEIHHYRGVFGAHVASVLRRLLRLAARAGRRPRVLLASATIGNPSAHAEALVGREVALVGEDTGPAPARAVVLWDAMASPLPYVAEVARVVATLTVPGRRTLCFAGSRRAAETVALAVGERAPGLRVSAYRAGYRPAERRALEAALEAGALDVLVTTNALELGVDLPHVDAVVLAGYPGTVAATWQQLGRAGRGERPAVGVLVAGEDPTEQFFLRQPDLLLAAPVEEARVALENLSVATGQTLCAAAEAPLRPEDVAALGPRVAEARDVLRREGRLRPTPLGDVFAGGPRPATEVSLDGRREDDVVVVAGDGTTLETLGETRALLEAYPGAVILHRGVAFRVRELDLSSRTAQVEPADQLERTRARLEVSYHSGPGRRERRNGAWTASTHGAKVTLTVNGYRRERAGVLVGVVELDLPPRSLETVGLEIGVGPTPSGLGEGRDLGAGGVDPPGGDGDPRPVSGEPAVRVPTADGMPSCPSGEGWVSGVHGAEHALRRALALLSMCDVRDVGGLVRPSLSPQVVLYDAFPGGAGIAELGLARFGALVRLARELVDTCQCDDGCPRCLLERFCAHGDLPISRRAASEVLRALAEGRPPVA